MPSALGSPCQDSQQQTVNVPAAPQAALNAARVDFPFDCSQQYDAVAAVHGLITRLLGKQHAQLFSLALAPCTPKAPHGHFTVCVHDATVHVSGTSGVQLASGVHWFLKYFARCSVSWELTGGVQVDAACFSAPSLAGMQARGSVTVERAVPLSFYQNVVTMSYSMAFWEWERCVWGAAEQLCTALKHFVCQPKMLGSSQVCYADMVDSDLVACVWVCLLSLLPQAQRLSSRIPCTRCQQLSMHYMSHAE
jgi:hypothetical protein